MRIRWIALALCLLLSLPMLAADISGKWQFSVDLDGGGHGDPTFAFQQKGNALTGTYTGPIGEQKVTGTIKGNDAEFGFSFERDGNKVKVTYSGKIETAKTMSGAVKFEGAQQGGGHWTATKQ